MKALYCTLHVLPSVIKYMRSYADSRSHVNPITSPELRELLKRPLLNYLDMVNADIDIRNISLHLPENNPWLGNQRPQLIRGGVIDAYVDNGNERPDSTLELNRSVKGVADLAVTIKSPLTNDPLDGLISNIGDDELINLLTFSRLLYSDIVDSHGKFNASEWVTKKSGERAVAYLLTDVVSRIRRDIDGTDPGRLTRSGSEVRTLTRRLGKASPYILALFAAVGVYVYWDDIRDMFGHMTTGDADLAASSASLLMTDLSQSISHIDIAAARVKYEGISRLVLSDAKSASLWDDLINTSMSLTEALNATGSVIGRQAQILVEDSSSKVGAEKEIGQLRSAQDLINILKNKK
jgi:hypothetical protein